MNSSLLFRSTRSILSSPFICRQCRRWASQGRVFKDGDLVLVKRIGGRDQEEGNLITLNTSQRAETHRGTIPHNQIIGRRSGELVRSHVGKQFYVFEPSLAEYVTLSRRLVTPVYPQDANVIVSLLDIHASLPAEDEPPLEILEVGTGQGSLTLHIARAIHAFNGEERKGDKRRAILHTTDIVAKHSEHAEKVVKGFRHGLYANNVDFHVGTLDQFFTRIRDKREVGTTPINTTSSYPDAILHPPSTASPPELSTASDLDTPPSTDLEFDTPSTSSESDTPTTQYTPPLTPFLSHIIIDTPNSNTHLEQATSHLLPSGKIIIFNPSITQIADCTETIKRLRLPLVQETVLELGQGISGGRVWDVRAVLPRHEEREVEKARRKEGREVESGSQEEKDALSEFEAVAVTVEEEALKKADEEQKFVMVCRPKVGRMIIGGGFVGIWRKTC